MKQTIEIIPVNDAFDAHDECPFCHMERLSEQRSIRYVIGPGASYMEPDVRDIMDREGFCREHYKKLYDYGNALGNGLLLQTYYAGLLKEMDEQLAHFTPPGKRSLLNLKKTADDSDLQRMISRRVGSCYICRRNEESMRRYYATFFHLVKDAEFRAKVENSKGFCLRHFGLLLQYAQEFLPNSQYDWFYETVIPLMRQNMGRVKEDIDWFVGMFDYRQAGADWKNSRDAVSRGMQKLEGLYPADKPYKSDP